MGDTDNPDAGPSAGSRERLEGILREAALGDADVERAWRGGRLPTLAVEVALGDGGEHTLSEVARAAKLPSPVVRELMQALGRPDPGRGEHAFTSEDGELARIAHQMLDAGLPERELTEVARVIGLAMAQSADAVRRLVGEAYLEPGDSEAMLAARYVDAAEKLGPLIPDLFALTFRAHLRDGISGQLLTEAERRSGRLSDTEDVAVAFADLVGYTSLGYRLSDSELGSLAGRFATAGVAAARPPVRLVKTIGDPPCSSHPTPALCLTCWSSCAAGSSRTRNCPLFASAWPSARPPPAAAIGSEPPSTSPAASPRPPSQASYSPPKSSPPSPFTRTGGSGAGAASKVWTAAPACAPMSRWGPSATVKQPPQVRLVSPVSTRLVRPGATLLPDRPDQLGLAHL